VVRTARSVRIGAIVGALLSAAIGTAVPAAAAPSEILATFTPDQVQPGGWTLDIDEEQAPGLAPECPGRRRLWGNGDGIRFALLWGACTGETVQPVKRSLEASRSTVAELRRLSVLDGADVVEPTADNGIIRAWVQDNRFVAVGATCGAHGRRLCVDITVRAAVLVSSGMPGAPSRTGLLPPMSRFAGAAVVAWSMLVVPPVSSSVLCLVARRWGR
jgi:hypothetical protein